MLTVAGGLLIEHPLILPYIKQVVCFTTFARLLMTSQFKLHS